MESSIKDKYIILGFVGFAIVLISSIATLVIADSFNQDNFVRWIVFVCCNLLGWLLYLSFQTLIFDTYEIYKIKFGKKETIAEAIEVQEELSQNTLEEATSVPGPTDVVHGFLVGNARQVIMAILHDHADALFLFPLLSACVIGTVLFVKIRGDSKLYRLCLDKCLFFCRG
jgi:hypothetical protein